MVYIQGGALKMKHFTLHSGP